MAWKKILFEGDAGGSGTKIEDADADTKVDVEEGADDDTVRIDVGGASAVPDALVITGAGGIVSKLNVVPDADSAIDLGSSAPKYWRYVYADRMYLNPTLYIDGASAGILGVAGFASGGIQLAAGGGYAANGATPTSLKAFFLGGAISGSVTGLSCEPTITLTANSQAVKGLYGLANIPAYTNTPLAYLHAFGLDFSLQASLPSSVSPGMVVGYTELVGAHIKVNALAPLGYSQLTVDQIQGIYLEKGVHTKGANAQLTITDFRMVDLRDPASAYIKNLYGLKIDDCSAATGGAAPYNRILELGPAVTAGVYLRLLGSGSWAPAALSNETPIYLAEASGAGPTKTMRQVKWFDPGNLGVNFVAGQRVMVLV